MPRTACYFSHPAPHRRAAFAFGGWIMLLFLILIGACIVNSYLTWSRLPPAGNSAYQGGVRIGIWSVPVIIPLVALGISWLVGKLVSLMFGKSDDAGNIGGSIVLLAFIALFGYGIYNLSTAPAPAVAPAPTTAMNSPLQSPPATTDPTEAARRLAEQGQAQLKAMQERSQQNLEAAREASRKQLEALRNGTPMPRPAPTPPASSSTPTTPDSASPAAPSTPQLNPAIRSVIDAFEKDLTAQVESVAALAARTLPELQRTPPHDAARIKSRLAEVESLRVAADAIKKTFDGASDALTAKLLTAGITDSETRTAASRWSAFDYKVTTRGFAAGSLIRLCDQAREECEYLRDNLGKWTLDGKGEVKCNDFQTKSRIGSLRFFVKSDADRKQQLIDQLSGK